MIFFIIDQDTRPFDFSIITTPQPAEPQPRQLVSSSKKKEPKNDASKLIAWNEVFRTIEEFRAFVMAVAGRDPVCQDMQAQALFHFGMDPFLEVCEDGMVDKKAMQDLLEDTFFHWAHPTIGNIGNSPNIRPATFVSQYVINWNETGLIDQETKTAIVKLFEQLGPLKNSGRDQVRICANITQLARAFIGEITCAGSKRLEKILALRLCQSRNLLDVQQQMLCLYMDKKAKAIATSIARNMIKFGNLEYCRYYFPKASELAGEDFWYFLQCLISSATEEKYKVNSKPMPESAASISGWLKEWNQLPPPIRCAILMNDFRKIERTDKAPRNPEPVSLGNMHIATLLPLKGGIDIPYGITEGPRNTHIPRFDGKWGLAWSWNRDEYHPVTMTYRHYLCPLWAGPSGHTRGGLSFWCNTLADDFPRLGAIALTSGLFALWRLYYDKRISVNHTLTETYEATCLGFLTGIQANKGPEYSLEKVPPLSTELLDGDAFDIVVNCTHSRGFVDPILLLRTLKTLYYQKDESNRRPAYDNLLIRIDQERRALTIHGFKVPQWSLELSKEAGFQVQSFDEKQQQHEGKKHTVPALMDLALLKAIKEHIDPTETLNEITRREKEKRESKQ